MKQPVEQSVIQMARKGDQDAIGKLYDETKHYAYSIARQYLRNDADAEDALQEAYSSAFEKLDTIEKEMSFKPWLYKIVSNKCLNFIKGTRAVFVPAENIGELTADNEEAFPAEWLEKAEKRRDIMRLIDALPEGHRLAILLHYMEGYSISEIADTMGVAEGTVKNHLYHGRQAIKALVLEEEKKGNKLYGLAPMPMLAKVFELEAESTVMPEALSKAVWERTLNNLIANGVIPNAGANTTSTASSPSDAGTNTPNANISAANVSVNAAGAEAANKGGLIKMFLGLSTGKKVGVIAAVLAIPMCLSLLASALAAPTPTPTPTPTPKSTPAIGVQPPPNGPGGGGSGGGGGTKPGDGPSGTSKPEATSPPKKETPEGEDNTPIEVEVDPDLDADIKPKKGKAKEYEKQAVWTISFKKATASAPNKNAPEAFLENYTMDFVATKQGSGGMLGSYVGEGYLQNVADTSGYIGQSHGAVFQMDMAWEGPLSGIAFELYAPSSDADEEELAPLVETLAPLVKPTYTGWVGSKMTWEAGISLNHVESVAGSGPMKEVDGTMPLTYYIYTYPGGRADLHLLGTTAATDYLTFRGTISKKISWKQVK